MEKIKKSEVITFRTTEKVKEKLEKPTKDTDVVALEDDLSKMLGAQVSIKWNGKKGSMTIHYDSLGKLDTILQKLTQTS